MAHPTVSQMFSDGGHHQWLRPYPARSNGIGVRKNDAAAALEEWTILRISDGAQVQTTLPVVLSLTDIGENHIAGIWTDADGLESVRVYYLSSHSTVADRTDREAASTQLHCFSVPQ